MKIFRSLGVLLFLTAFILVWEGHAFAQAYPTKPIRVIVPFSAGGSNDLICRALVKPMGKELKGSLLAHLAVHSLARFFEPAPL